MTYQEALTEALEAIRAAEDLIPNTAGFDQDHRTIASVISSLRELIDAEVAA